MIAINPGEDWLHQAMGRIGKYWLLKMLGTTGYMALFMAGYFWLLRHPMYPVTVMPLTGLDDLVRFEPWSIVLYGSLWLYISFVPLLINNRRELVFLPQCSHRPESGWFCLFLLLADCRSRVRHQVGALSARLLPEVSGCFRQCLPIAARGFCCADWNLAASTA